MTQSTPDSLVPPPGRPSRTRLYGEAFAADPAATYDALRAHGHAAPVELAPGVPATLIVGYQAALEVLRNPATFPKDPRRWQTTVPPDSPILPMTSYRPNCQYADGAAHARLRGAVTGSLERVDLTALRGHIARCAVELISDFASTGRADLLHDYAEPLPLRVFTHLFGCPPSLGEQLAGHVRDIFDGVNAEQADAKLLGCLNQLIALKRARPRTDVLSWLMEHPARLTDEELVHQLVLLMGAGQEPQQNLIANGLLLLLSDDSFAGDLSGGSMPVDDALDAILWTDPPMPNYGISYPVRDVDLFGTTLPADQPVVIGYAAANTDPTLRSEHRAGNRAHLAWSAGPHACPAQQIARLIGSVAIETVLDRLPGLQLAVPADQLTWRPGPFHRALTALPVRFPKPSAAFFQHDPSGDRRWNDRRAPSASTRLAGTSTRRVPGSAARGRHRWWNSLVRWWHGQ
ncbi:cytochrome P450 [Umezawaea beigongshangensis]|uniref:cytochrome P450 n=1 Tax=Umezawaea beigongshangensis TaxID=2780383 RepID=UPI0027DB1628|nr:cytochrome P450 [Umezawaea beigongshangensis]